MQDKIKDNKKNDTKSKYAPSLLIEFNDESEEYEVRQRLEEDKYRVLYRSIDYFPAKDFYDKEILTREVLERIKATKEE